MKPLIVLIAVFCISVALTKITTNQYNILLSGKLVMSAMLLFTAVGHFVFTQGITMMVPSYFPFKKEIVYFSGALEILIAVGLLIPYWSKYSAWALIALLELMLPANIYASINYIDYPKGNLMVLV